MVKAAPTFKPQIINSKERLMARAAMVQQRLRWLKFRSTEGYKIKCGRAELQLLSAQPEASVVGATANLLMEVDEAQDIDIAKFDKDFRPMTASTAATMVFYGTPWTDSTLLAQTNNEIEGGQVAGRVFRVLPDVVAESNPAYGQHIDREVRRMGRDHPLVRTQYFLEVLPEQGRLLKSQQLEAMVGTHPRQAARSNQRWIVAGLDFAGSDELAMGPVSLMTKTGRDSVALTIGEAEMVKVMQGMEYPRLKILARYEWTNVRPDSLHTMLFRLLNETWKVNYCVADATGIGETNTNLLAMAMNKSYKRLEGVKFDGEWKLHSHLGFNYLAAVNGGRLVDFAPVDAKGVAFDPLQVASAAYVEPSWEADRVAWWQRGHALLRTKPGEKAKIEVPEKDGHDDVLLSELLCLEAAHILLQSRPQSSLA